MTASIISLWMVSSAPNRPQMLRRTGDEQIQDFSLQSYGVILVSKMPSLPNEHQDDIVHLLINAARVASTADKEIASKVLLQLLPGLSEKSRASVEQFLNEAQDSKS